MVLLAILICGCALQPQISGIYDVRGFGACGDGRTKDTAAMQAAIDAAHAAGGGEVRVPAGRYVVGSVFLKSNVDFHVCAGATIEGSREPADYNKWDVCPQNSRSVAENHEGGHLFLCIEQTNVVLRGEGTIDGNGRYFMSHGYDKSRVGKRTGRNGLGGSTRRMQSSGGLRRCSGSASRTMCVLRGCAYLMHLTGACFSMGVPTWRRED